VSPRQETLGGRALRASAWTVGGFGAGQLIRFGANLVLTRLMFPDVFGLAAIVFTFIQGLYMFSDVGTGPAVIQSPRGDEPRFLDTAWTIQAIRGGGLLVASCLIAAPVAAFYGQPLLAWLIPAAGLGAFADGFVSMSIQTAQRHLKVKWVTLVDLASHLLNVLTMIATALVLRRLLGPTDLRLAWATVTGTVVGEVFRVVLSHAVVPGQRHRLHLDAEARKVLLGFGRLVFLSTALTFLAAQSDRLLFAKLIPLEVLGVYGIAAALGGLPAQTAQRLSSSVLFPAFSRLHEQGELGAAFWRGRLPVLLAGATLVSGLLASGPFLIRILYDARYAQASIIIQFLALASWFQILDATNGAALLASGRVHWMAAGHATKLLAILALVPLGFHRGGFLGALAGLVLADLLRYLTSVVGRARGGLGEIGRAHV